MRASLEAFGISAEAAAVGIAGIAAAVDKVKLAQLNEDIKTLEQNMASGLGPNGSAAFNRITEAAKGLGKESEVARQFLDKIGAPLPEGALQSLEQLIQKFGQTEGLRRFAEQLDKIKDAAERNAAIMATWNNTFGVEVVKAMNAGGSAVEIFRENIKGLDQDAANTANKVDELFNRLTSAWKRFNTAIGSSSMLANTLREATNLLDALSTLLNATPDKWRKAFDAAIVQPMVDAVRKLVLQPIENAWEVAHGRIPEHGQRYHIHHGCDHEVH